MHTTRLLTRRELRDGIAAVAKLDRQANVAFTFRHIIGIRPWMRLAERASEVEKSTGIGDYIY